MCYLRAINVELRRRVCVIVYTAEYFDVLTHKLLSVGSGFYKVIVYSSICSESLKLSVYCI